MVLIGKSYTAWRTDSQVLGLGRHNYCRYVAQDRRESGPSREAWVIGLGNRVKQYTEDNRHYLDKPESFLQGWDGYVCTC